MPPLEFPRSRIGSLQELGARLLDSRKAGTSNETFARELLAGFHDCCIRVGLDRLLAELEETEAEISDRAALADHPRLFPAMVAKLGTIDIDDGGPRNAKPRIVADCLVAGLGLTLVDDVERTITLDDQVRSDIGAAMASVVEVALAVPHVRDTIIAGGRARCDPQYLSTFDKMAAQLDERGMSLIKQPKVPLDAQQAVLRVLYETRNAVIGRVAGTAIDRAKEVLARANPDAAARIDLPVTLRLTPRQITILRVCDARVPKAPSHVLPALLESLTDVAGLVWRAPERVVRAYAASQTFLIGELLEHPKFGRGSVTGSQGPRIDVEFPDGKHTLVHNPPRK